MQDRWLGPGWQSLAEPIAPARGQTLAQRRVRHPCPPLIDIRRAIQTERSCASRSTKVEEDFDFARPGETGAQRVACALQQTEHAAILGPHDGPEYGDTVGLRVADEPLQQPPADSLPLEAVFHQQR